MIPRNALATIGAMVVLCTTASACSSNSDNSQDKKPSTSASHADKGQTNDPGKSDTSENEQGDTTDTKAETGLVLAVCSPDRQIWYVNNDGTVTAKKHFALSRSVDEATGSKASYESLASCNANQPGRLMRAAFDATFDNAVNRLTYINGQQHIGITPAFGTAKDEVDFKDLSGAADTTFDDTAPKVNQSVGSFGPNGTIIFTQESVDPNGDNTLKALDVKTGKITNEPDPGKVGYHTSAESDIVFERYDKLPISPIRNVHDAVFTPDGSWAFWADFSSIAFGPKPGENATEIDVSAQKDVGLPFAAASKTKFFGYDKGEVGEAQLYRNVVNGNSIESTPLLTLTGRDVEITEPMLSTDGETIYFIRETADGAFVCSVPADGGKIAKLMAVSSKMDDVRILDTVS